MRLKRGEKGGLKDGEEKGYNEGHVRRLKKEV